jgi:hypothetical protein
MFRAARREDGLRSGCAAQSCLIQDEPPGSFFNEKMLPQLVHLIMGFAPLEQAGNSVKAQKAIAYVADKVDINLSSPFSMGMK